MGAIERNGYRFNPEYSVINQKGAIHVYHEGKFMDEIPFTFQGPFPDHDQIEKMVDAYCIKNQI